MGAFRMEPRVTFVDIHECGSTLFPHTPDSPGQGAFPGNESWTGEGPATGTKLNLPLPAGAGDDVFLAAWERAESFVRSKEPAFIVFESGVDCLEGDPLANLKVTPAAIRHVTARVCAIADEYAEGRLLVVGGGGYVSTIGSKAGARWLKPTCNFVGFCWPQANPRQPRYCLCGPPATTLVSMTRLSGAFAVAYSGM